MGKIDDMRRQRERQVAEADARRASAPTQSGVEPAAPPPAPKRDVAAALTAAHAALAPKAPSPDDAKGTCSVCGKTKGLANGVLVQHQKGLGKPCAGSRKPPA